MQADQLDMGGAEFREWRRAAGLSQEDAGELLGVTRRTIILWEQAVWIPRTAALAVRWLRGR